MTANERCPLAVGGALRRLFRRNDPYENLDLAATLIETAMGLVGPFFKDRRRPQGLDRAIAAVNAGAARLRTMAGRGSGRAGGHDDGDDDDDDEGDDDDDLIGPIENLEDETALKNSHNGQPTDHKEGR